jgi:hyperosmotically inducible periplasmic protein
MRFAVSDLHSARAPRARKGGFSMRRSMISIFAIGAVALSVAACHRNNGTSQRSEAERGRVDTMARADRPNAVGNPTPSAPNANAPQPGRYDQQANRDADDTGVNQRDRAPGAVTPMDQSNSDRDLEVTRQIRQGITSDDSLSTEARNVKIVTDGGVVVLRGPVESAQEKAAIVAIATRTPGVTRVDDQLEVARD